LSWACSKSSLVNDHFALRLSSRDEQRLRDHLGTCHTCALRYRRWSLFGQQRGEPAGLGQKPESFQWLQAGVVLVALLAMAGGGVIARAVTSGAEPQFQARAR
jgi:hypothetical protein